MITDPTVTGLPDPKLRGYQFLTEVNLDFTVAAALSVASHEVFTVTGTVEYTVLYLCITDLTSGGSATIQFGREGATDSVSASQAFSGIDAGEIIIPGGTNASISASATHRANTTAGRGSDIITGLDLGYEIGTAAMTGGTMKAYCWWTPITDGASVVAGALGAL
jgi:hypothetical protein